MALTRTQRALAIRWTIYAISLAVVVVAGAVIDWGSLRSALFEVDVIPDMFPAVLTQAAKNTLIFTSLGFSLGLVLGLVLALMRLSTIRPYRWFASIYIDIFRGLPALLTILLIGFALPTALGGWRIPGTYGPGSIAVGIVASAYMAETIRAGIQAVPRGQMEAARSVGMTYAQAMIYIVIPQAFRIIIPPLTNEFILLLKDTSLISVLGVTAQTKELTRFGRDFVIDTANATPIVVVGLVYLAMTIPLTRLVAQLEKRAARAR